ncbi:hypothetical protein LJB42_001387 [Komagataella kurtzmanii]|nr:hypothetical protein LJB42_001387 [Komagataella kurtzmanii]
MVQLIPILVLIFLLFCFILIVLFGDLPSYRGTLIPRIRRTLILILSRLGNGLVAADRRFLGGVVTKLVSSPIIRKTLGWLIPSMYFVIMWNCLKLFFNKVYPTLYSQLEFILVIVPTLIVNFSSFLLATFISPGVPTHTDLDKLLAQFPYNGLIFHSFYDYKFSNPEYYNKKVTCSTCHLTKIPRSKHCSHCGQCFLFLDHHCIWLNNCVGYNNYKWFLIFLVDMDWVFLYGGYLNYKFLKNQIADEVPWSSYLLEIWVLRKVSFDNEVAQILLLLCTVLFPVVFGFTIEHFRNIYLGVTTSETAKWKFIQALIEEGILYQYSDKNTQCTYLIKSRLHFLRLDNEETFKDIDFMIGRLSKIESIHDIDNIYDKGFLQNFKERMRIR